jgi:putative addiction module CopG family antidote
METMNIALPEAMKHFVQDRVSEGGYSSVSEYVRKLIRADQKRKVEERIDGLLLERRGMNGRSRKVGWTADHCGPGGSVRAMRERDPGATVPSKQTPNPWALICVQGNNFRAGRLPLRRPNRRRVSKAGIRGRGIQSTG